MINLNELLNELTEIENKIQRAAGATSYNGPLIDAERHIMNAKERLRRHLSNEQKRAAAAAACVGLCSATK